MSERRVEDYPIKFGPLWLRSFSREGSAGASGGSAGSGGSTTGAPPASASNRQQPQPTKYKLAQYRYGREEMLALYENELDPPGGLQAFEPLYVPDNQRPLALTTDAPDDEPREHARIVGLNRNAGVAGSGGGPTAADRFGRGLSDLSRGRGRPHQPYSLASSERPTSYREDNPYGEPPAPGLTRSWSSGPNSSLGRGNTDNPDWNQNRPYKSRWPEPNWRSQTGRAYGEENEPSRRVLVPLGRPRQPLDKRDKEKSDRPTSWTASRRAWTGEQHFTEDNLPEWATEGDTEASGGTFDSSGAFHDVDAPARRPGGDSFYGLARSHTQGSIGTRSRSQDEENPVASEPQQGWWNSDKGSEAPPKKFDATNIKFKNPPATSEETSRSEKNESSFETSDDQFEKAVAKAKHLKIDDAQTDPKKKMVSFSEEKFGPNKTFDALMRMKRQTDEAIDERGNYNSTLININNNSRQKHQDIVTQPQPVPAQPEPPQHERKVLSENNTARMPKPEDIGANKQGVGARSRGLDAFTAFGLPSMPIDVPSTQGPFQPYTEPSPHKVNDGTPYHSGVDTQDMLKNAALQMVNDSNTWYYEDPQKNVQGPFTPSEMRQWYRAGFFSPDLMIRRACDKEMRSLGSFGEIPPFAENVSELLAFLTRKIMMTENDGPEKPEDPLQQQKAQLQQLKTQLQQQKTLLQHPQLPQSQLNQSTLQQNPLQQLLMSQQQSQMPQSAMTQPQNPQSQMLQSLLHESHRQQLQLQQSQLLQLQLQQSQLQQSQLDPSPVQQSFLQQPQMQQTQIHPAHLHQPQLLPSQLQQSQLQNPLLPQTPLHQATLQPSLLSQPQLPPTSLHQSQLPQSKLNQMPLPQQSLQDMLMNKTPLQSQPGQWNASHQFVSPAMLATNVAAPPTPTPAMTFGNRTHSTFLEQIIQTQRAAAPVPEKPLPDLQNEAESIHMEQPPASPATTHNFSFLSRPPPPITTRVHADVAETHPARGPVVSESAECSVPKYLEESALYPRPEASFDSTKAAAATEEPRDPTIKKVDPTPEIERESVRIAQPSPVTVDPKQQKTSSEIKEKSTKSKESKTKSKSSKTKERRDESGDTKTERQDTGKNEAKVEELPGFTKVVNKKEEKQSKKDKKEAIQEIPAATKASQRKNADKKKSEEVKAAEEAERKRKEDQRYRIVEDLKEEAFFINNLEKKYKHMEAQLDKARQQPQAATATASAPTATAATAPAAGTASKKAPWSAPSPTAPAANTDGLTLAEIQKLEREKKFETIKEQQQMMQLIAQQQQAALAREQEIQQTTGYNWAKYKPNKNNDSESVQSLAEIQEETRRRQMLEIARQEPAAPPPVAAAATANQAPWINGGSAYLGGFWESPPSGLGKPEEKVASPRKSTTEPQPGKSKKASKANASPAKEPKKTSPTAEFDTWCLKVLTSWSSKIDVPIFVGFLKDIESAYEVKDYVKSYLGETKESTDFARNFLEKRSKLLRGAQSECVDDLSAPAAAKNPVSGAASDFQELKGKGKKVKKNKMLKVDTRILGFSVTAAENRINVGDIESL